MNERLAFINTRTKNQGSLLFFAASLIVMASILGMHCKHLSDVNSLKGVMD